MIPLGLCQCGCGQPTPVARWSNKRYGWVKDQPMRFVLGHRSTITRLPLDSGPTFKIDGVYCRLIPLTLGQYAIVDDADYESLMCHRWHARYSPHANKHYACRKGQKIGRKQQIVPMHRELLGLAHGDILQGDHVDPLATLDNRRANLRIASGSQNQWNRGRYASNRAGYKGVYWNKRSQKWAAGIQVYGKRISLGLFDVPEEAYEAYCAAANRYHGEFARVA